jgi:hypothetical protein
MISVPNYGRIKGEKGRIFSGGNCHGELDIDLRML